VFALCGGPQLARADAFVPPEGKTAVEVTIAIENLAEHPDYWFVLWPDGCLHNDETFATYTMLNHADDDGRSELQDDGCVDQRLFAFPRGTYSAAEGVLPEAARRQLSDDPPTDPRVLVETIDAEEQWWVPDEVDLYGIEDVYRIGIGAGGLTLTPTRVRFDFGGGRVFERAFYKGRRPRLPRAQDIPPAPSPDADAPPTPAPSPSPEPVDATAASPVADPAPALVTSPDADGSPVAPAPAPATEPPPADAGPEEISAEPWPPPPVVYGGLCLLVALAAGLALRRR